MQTVNYRRMPLLLCLLTIFTFFQAGYSQNSGGVYVDDQGVMRWTDSDAEIQGFGVNYTLPFAHAYRSAKKLGIDPLRAIDEDVYHFARLGFDLYRVHVWDTEISDTLGNLLYNEHLHAFDYLLKKLSERNINYVLTPIAYWGNGWPEPDEKTPGFSAKYGKGDCLTNPAAIKAQENYLAQFLDHVNPYTGIAYKDDPRLIAVEVSNEPHHREAPEQVTAFLQRMVEAMRKTGYAKPIFYNISHSVHLAENYFAADIQGGTFQWYPTGLGYQQELPGNYLPNVDDYNIPFDPVIRENQGAKLVYEFDAADVGGSYIYPAMARSFRKAGIQIATHFAYDPTYLAYANTEYNTHYMNLAYTPRKALSLKICSEVFHRIPLYKDFGNYPENTNFAGFKVDYERDLAQLNIDDRFFYTNTTEDSPVNENALQHIAGTGSSPLVSYGGNGAYFLDKLEDGVWRLEVMPDALIIGNPYGRNSLDKTNTVIQWNDRKMQVKLRDLGGDFQLRPINSGNRSRSEVNDGTFTIRPGVYLLSRPGLDNKWKGDEAWQNIRLNEFHAPAATVDKTYIVHEAPEVAVAGEDPLRISAQVISPDPNPSVSLLVAGGFRGRNIDLERTGPFTYEATIPADRLQPGFLTYYLTVRGEDGSTTFPSGKSGLPYRWDFYDRTPYRVRVIGPEQPISLFDAEEDADALSVKNWINTLRLLPLDDPKLSEYQVNVQRLFQEDPENLQGEVLHDYTLRHYLNPKIDPVREQLAGKKTLLLTARAMNERPTRLQLALIDKKGNAYGVVLDVAPELGTYEIPVSALRKTRTVTMPRPYPTFLPYFFAGGTEEPLDLRDIEAVQFSIGPGIPVKELEYQHGIGLVSLTLE
ncbi:glycoside hydrolase 5 family protein [Flavilitoribacter nigricans]|uniref:Membrane or secreted protein n=1 Tax=Flavilitoribacter nigricans (strain ATCC 23147 / DSM 23189 / NBRC 102662 / NCIMB 1420 / SS-2) TaxID=1122177 RepID=A0A2D0N1R0_FLAN2|nr:hypothetical protein [Flavilitoribacter nigricans]PHN01653.1 hypothetical protein CRP01_36155 [Flavilitoribacter nigricans DSM 23189 = NBRC 102662]